VSTVVLRAACPSGVDDAGAGDEVGGVAPSWVARPRGPGEVAELLRAADGLGMRTVARGAGTKLDWGADPEGLELVVDLSAMSSVLEHSAEDLVVRAEAGCPLAELQRLLSRAGQRLPVDEVVEGSTVGGAVATGICGPLRHRFGAVRDMVLGVSFVRADGVAAKSGSKVVKNVAGYDLAKLFTGSFGTLGVLTEVILRARPLPRHEAFVLAAFEDVAETGARLRALAHSGAVPSAVEARRDGRGPLEAAVLLEGAAPLDSRVGEVTSILGDSAAVAARPSWWGALPGRTTIKVAVPLRAVPLVLGVADLPGIGSSAPLVSGSAGVGVFFVGLPTSAGPEEVRSLVGVLRTLCLAEGGSAVVLRAPPEVRDSLDVWGPVDGLELMRRIKREFDPGRRLSPGRFVGGI